MNRKNITELQRRSIGYNQNYRCNHCSYLLPPRFDIDHIKPLSEGGSNKDNNLQALCPSCHCLKTGKEISLRCRKIRHGIVVSNSLIKDTSEFILQLVKDNFFIEEMTEDIWYSNKHGFIQNRGPITRFGKILKKRKIPVIMTALRKRRNR